MKRGLALILAAAVAAASLAAPVADAENHSVTFTAKATGLAKSAKAEFLFITPDSDHDYEAVFKLDDNAKDIMAALTKAGIPRGIDYDIKRCRLWPVGVFLSLEPAITNFLCYAEGDSLPQIVYSGGVMGENGLPKSDTESPCAFFAMYNCPQSQLQFNASLDQTPTYGRFTPVKELAKGEKVTFTLSWNGQHAIKPLDIKLSSGNISSSINILKEQSADCELDVTPDFDPELSLGEAASSAEVLRMLDSSRVKINGFKDGQFFFRAFLPLEKWRDRNERLAQPPEIRLVNDGFLVTEVIEDWSNDDSFIPKLKIVEHVAATYDELTRIAKPIAEKTYTVFLFAPPETKLSKLYDIKRALKSDLIWNWYVFQESTNSEHNDKSLHNTY